MKRLVLFFLLLSTICMADGLKGKYVIILQAGNETNEGAARAVHALLYAAELVENGYEVALIFDGAGSGWAVQFRQKDHPLYEKYKKIAQMGVVLEICDHCAEKFDVKDQLSDQQLTLLSGDYEGHPSLVRWIEKGYQVLTL